MNNRLKKKNSKSVINIETTKNNNDVFNKVKN